MGVNYDLTLNMRVKDKMEYPPEGGSINKTFLSDHSRGRVNKNCFALPLQTSYLNRRKVNTCMFQAMTGCLAHFPGKGQSLRDSQQRPRACLSRRQTEWMTLVSWLVGQISRDIFLFFQTNQLNQPTTNQSPTHPPTNHMHMVVAILG